MYISLTMTRNSPVFRYQVIVNAGAEAVGWDRARRLPDATLSPTDPLLQAK